MSDKPRTPKEIAEQLNALHEAVSVRDADVEQAIARLKDFASGVCYEPDCCDDNKGLANAIDLLISEVEELTRERDDARAQALADRQFQSRPTADKFVRLLVSKSRDYDPSDYDEVLSNPEFWAADYAHALDKLAEVLELQQRVERGETALADERRALREIVETHAYVSNGPVLVRYILAALDAREKEGA
jgi:hypothetical protein